MLARTNLKSLILFNCLIIISNLLDNAITSSICHTTKIEFNQGQLYSDRPTMSIEGQL